MKNLTTTLGIATVALALGLTSCGGKKVNSNPSTGSQDVKLEIPCEDEGMNTKEYFAASGTGESIDRETAKKKALSNCRAALAANINTTVKTVTDNFVNSREYNNKEEIEERYESLTREVVNQELKGQNIVCQEVTFNSGSEKYTYYVAIQLSGADLLTKMNESLAQDERIKIDYDYEKFKETFNAEMDKMGN